MLGGLVMAALQMLNQRGAATGQSSLSLAEMLGSEQVSPMVVDTSQAHRQALAFVKAMINAAKADGQIDGAEMNNILSKLDEAGAGQDAKDFVLAEMRRPLDLDGLVAAAGTPDLAAAVYAASVMAIKVDTPAERTYLDQLAARLALAPSVRASLDASLGVGRAV